MKSRIISSVSAFLLALTASLVVGVSPAHAALTYFYAGGSQTLSTAETSVGANLLVANPGVSAGDFHSLTQITVLSSDSQQVVEVGWTKDPGVYGDNNIHLFSTFWKNSAFGGYNDTVWVDNAAVALNRNASISGDIGSIKLFGVIYSGGNWWVQYGTDYIGYFPGTNWTSPTFTSFMKFQGFGEVAANVAAPCTDMTNANYGDNTLTSGKVSSVTYSSGSSAVSLTPFATNASYYSVYAYSLRTVYIGGPGAC